MTDETPCPARCGRTRRTGHYLCGPCWMSLPAPARRALRRRDSRAPARLRELYAQVGRDVPLYEIKVTP